MHGVDLFAKNNKKLLEEKQLGSSCFISAFGWFQARALLELSVFVATVPSQKAGSSTVVNSCLNSKPGT